MIFSVQLKSQELTKEFHKEYKAGTETSLAIDNKYGDVAVQNWDNDQITIDVKVTLQVPDRSRAEKLIGYIDVLFTKEGDRISARTVIDEKFTFSGWGSSSRRFSIDYTVKMPSGSNFEVTNKYGNTKIAELNGYVQADIKYGNLSVVKLTRGNIKPLNRISIAYGKADIEEAGWLDINVRYSGSFEIEKSQALLVDSKYSKLRLGQASSIVGYSKYDNYRIGKINNLVMESGYTTIAVESLSKKLDLESKYGSFEAQNVDKGFESLETRTQYMGVNLGIDESADYRLEADISYGSIKFDESRFNNQKRIIQNTKTEISGIVGENPDPSSKVTVFASYGSVKLN
jgi:hypothetical protein